MEIKYFNHLGFELSVDEQANEVAVYNYLNNLWGDLFELTNTFSISGPTIRTPIDELHIRISQTQEEMNSLIKSREFSNLDVYLTDSNIVFLTNASNQFSDRIDELQKLRKEAISYASNNQLGDSQVKAFSIIIDDYNSLLPVVNDFVSRSHKSVKGTKRLLKKQKVGFIVNVILSPSMRPNVGSKSVQLSNVDFDYPVESTAPLLFHVGFTHAALNDVEYETVTSLSGDDLFLKVRDDDSLQNFSAFLSYPIDSTLVNEADWFVTLGTDFNDIGDNLYGGLTYRISEKWLFSAGIAYGLELTLDGSTDQMPVSSDNSETEIESRRTLFQTIEEDREATWFISISYNIF
tara:strand:+ start:5111 stop:6157 length:1047 start_codon:yes stop_codon:yes gene_type:complete